VAANAPGIVAVRHRILHLLSARRRFDAGVHTMIAKAYLKPEK